MLNAKQQGLRLGVRTELLSGGLGGMKKDAGVKVGDGFADDGAETLAGSPPAGGIKSLVFDGDDANGDIIAKGFLKEQARPAGVGAFGEQVEGWRGQMICLAPFFEGQGGTVGPVPAVIAGGNSLDEVVADPEEGEVLGGQPGVSFSGGNAPFFEGQAAGGKDAPVLAGPGDGGNLPEAIGRGPSLHDEKLAGGGMGDGKKGVEEHLRRQNAAEKKGGQEEPGPGGEEPSLLAHEQTSQPPFRGR